MKAIVIKLHDTSITAELYDTETAQHIWDALPIEGNANLWGEEIYFETPIALDMERDAREDVEVGTLAYWPVGNAFCIFFGRTPASEGGKPRAYSPVNIIGSVTGDVECFRHVQPGDPVHVEREQEQAGPTEEKNT